MFILLIFYKTIILLAASDSLFLWPKFIQVFFYFFLEAIDCYLWVYTKMLLLFIFRQRLRNSGHAPNKISVTAKELIIRIYSHGQISFHIHLSK